MVTDRDLQSIFMKSHGFLKKKRQDVPKKNYIFFSTVALYLNKQSNRALFFPYAQHYFGETGNLIFAKSRLWLAWGRRAKKKLSGCAVVVVHLLLQYMEEDEISGERSVLKKIRQT